MSKKILILGINGFIGSNLLQRILTDTDWHVYGLDLGADKITEFLGHERLHYSQGDITKSGEWLDRHIDGIEPGVRQKVPGNSAPWFWLCPG